MVEAPNPHRLHPISILDIYKVFSTLICCELAYGCTLTLLRLCRSGVNFWKIGVGLSPSDVVMSWLRLQTPIDCIPRPYHMYTKCFSTLICCEWAYGCTLTLLCLCRLGNLDNWGMAEFEWCCNVMVEAPNPCGLHPTSISYVYNVF